MTWIVIIVLGVIIVAVAAWSIPRAQRRRGHVDSRAVPPSPGSTAGGGVPLAPGGDPPPDDPGRPSG